MGQIFFMYIVLVSSVTGSDAWGIAGPLALFVMINIFGSISGGHFNPAVTTGIFIREQKYGENLTFYLSIVASQICGAIVGMLIGTLSCLEQQNGDYTINLGAPLLLPAPVATQVVTGAKDIDRDEIFSTIWMEVVCTFIFVLLILVVTGKRTIAPDLGSYGVFAICLNLWALSNVDAFTGASFNPALAISQTIFQYWWYPTNPSGVMWFYLPYYIIGAILGGVSAGVFYMFYETVFPEKEEVSWRKKNLVDDEGQSLASSIN